MNLFYTWFSDFMTNDVLKKNHWGYSVLKKSHWMKNDEKTGIMDPEFWWVP